MKKKTNAQRLRRVLVSIGIFYTLIIIAVAGILSFVIMHRCESYMTQETSSLIAADSKQLEMNINAYLEKIEKNVALMFSDDAYYKYDATDERMDAYDKLQYENAINDRIVDLGLMENYADFCIVYTDDHRVGWVSKTTENMFSEKNMYETMSSYITNEKSQDAWCFGVQDSYDRMYYVKRLHKNAVLVASFYSNELERAFEYPEEIKGMTIRLVTENGKIIYSSEKEEIGTDVASGHVGYLSSRNAVSVITAKELINTNVCENDWIVMCLVSRDVIMKDFYLLREFVMYASVIIAVLAILFCILLLTELSRPVGGIFETLTEKANVDELSGVLNKAGFTARAKDMLLEHPNHYYVVEMLDVDNFKQINDNLGHNYGDQVIARMGKLLRTNLMQDNILVGRLGGDEFAVFCHLDVDSIEIARKRVSNKTKFLMEEFAFEFAKEKQDLGVSLSVGIADSTESEPDYEKMLQAADKALYRSKRNGKDQYSVYRKEEVYDV